MTVVHGLLRSGDWLGVPSQFQYAAHAMVRDRHDIAFLGSSANMSHGDAMSLAASLSLPITAVPASLAWQNRVRYAWLPCGLCPLRWHAHSMPDVSDA